MAEIDKAALLADFKAKVDLFARYHGFIEKARQQADKFARAVVDKVIKDNTLKRDEVVAELVPFAADIDNVIAGLENQKQAVLDGQKDQKLALEEMELRQVIGELSEEEFKQQSNDVKDALEVSDGQVASLEEELKTFTDEMARWRRVGGEAGVLAEGPREEEVPENEPAEVGEPDANITDEVHVSGFQDEAADSIRFEQLDQGEERSEAFEGDRVDAETEVGDSDTLFYDALQSVEEEPKDRALRAVMLYQEGAAEEQVHPFTGEVLTVGRSGDNDIQVKNDSKVSRYHCKLYRRNGHFCIEDNESANGTLVNGELITERRLFGGEEIIIGETPFRFRIVE